jgi:NifU-like protein involved in Fe-S cluster formation
MPENDLKSLRDALIRCCEDYNADEAIRALASAMTTLLIGATADRAAALEAFDRLVKVMRDHVEDVARPAGASRQ